MNERQKYYLKNDELPACCFLSEDELFWLVRDFSITSL